MMPEFERPIQSRRIRSWKQILVNYGSRELEGLPLDQTSDVINRTSVGQRFTNSNKVINFALYLMDNHFNELSLNDVRRLVNEYFGYGISRTTIQRWKDTYRPNLNYKMSRRHYPSWNKAISLSVWFANQRKQNTTQGKCLP